MYKILSGIDFVAGIVYLLTHFEIIHSKILLVYFAIYIFIKLFSTGFEIDFANVLDLVCGTIILLGVLWTNLFLGAIILVWFSQKFLLSIF